MYLMNFLIVTQSCLFYLFVSCDSACKNSKTCGSCIGNADDHCVWCYAEDEIYQGRRCQSKHYIEENISWCKNKLSDPQLEKQLVEDFDLNAGENESKIVQFKPQKLNIKVRPGVPVKIDMSYKPAKDYPLDVYYLIDSSFTMREHTNKLKNQGFEIYKELTKFTNNVRLGIGSFIEKPILPVADPGSQLSYVFKNDLSLTENMTKFTDILANHKFGSNRDDPEAGFDALMQALICKDVGWRDNARRIIVLTTDNTYHRAGDGKFIGALIPHDMQCHFQNGAYDEMETIMDYPSVSQINKVVVANNFKIIFAIESKAAKHYKVLEDKIVGANYVPFSDRSDLVDLIKKEYLKLVSSIKLKSNVPPFMQLKIEPDCNIPNNCEIKHNEQLDITATLTVRSCPADNKKYTVEVGPISLNERLTINIDVDCKCDCEGDENSVFNSSMCHKAGTRQCGLCKCNENRYGDTCQCVGSQIHYTNLDECKINKNDSNYCSGRGSCICGKCENCSPGYSGDFCEVDDTACLDHNGRICSEHGKCRQGKCDCEPQWMGSDCSFYCTDDKQKCMTPYFNEVCSDSGNCICGECKCNAKPSTEEMCSGRYCDNCKELITKRCKDLEEYAYCNYYKNKTDCDHTFYKTEEIEVTLVSVSEITSPRWFNARWCKKLVKDNAIIIFRFDYGQTVPNNVQLIIQKELYVLPKSNTWAVVGGTIGAVLLIGILTLIIWKILVDLHDKKEYDKFVMDAFTAMHDVTCNDLYQEPLAEFSNPAFRKSHYNN